VHGGGQVLSTACRRATGVFAPDALLFNPNASLETMLPLLENILHRNINPAVGSYANTSTSGNSIIKKTEQLQNNPPIESETQQPPVDNAGLDKQPPEISDRIAVHIDLTSSRAACSVFRGKNFCDVLRAAPLESETVKIKRLSELNDLPGKPTALSMPLAEFNKPLTDEDRKKLDRLKSLTIDCWHADAKPNETFVENLLALPALEALEITNRQCRKVASGVKIDWLEHQFTDDQFARLVESGGLAKLRTLNLSGARITDKSVAYIAKCSSLEILLLRNCKHITCKSLSKLNELTNLQELDLGRTGVEGEGMSALGEIRSLKILNLSGCPGRPTELFIKLAECKSLRELILDDIRVPNDHLAIVTQYPNLHVLGLSESIDLTVTTAILLGKSRSIRALDLGYTSVVNDALTDLALECPNLEQLKIDGKISLKDLKDFVDSSQSLRTLYLPESRYWHAFKLQKKYPKLTVRTE
jgi:Leucine-rich repeat (LRR) protein